MKSPQLTNLPILTVVVFALGAGGVSMAQTEPEEELEIIELGDRYDEDESASEDDTLGGLIYAQGQSGSPPGHNPDLERGQGHVRHQGVGNGHVKFDTTPS